MTNWVLKSRKVARPLFSWTNTGRWPLKEYTFPSRSSKATSELMCVTPAGKIGNCTCGMPKLLPHSGKKSTLLPEQNRLISLPLPTYALEKEIRSCDSFVAAGVEHLRFCARLWSVSHKAKIDV